MASEEAEEIAPRRRGERNQLLPPLLSLYDRLSPVLESVGIADAEAAAL
jgi:hypothetical protein